MLAERETMVCIEMTAEMFDDDLLHRRETKARRGDGEEGRCTKE